MGYYQRKSFKTTKDTNVQRVVLRGGFVKEQERVSKRKLRLKFVDRYKAFKIKETPCNKLK